MSKLTQKAIKQSFIKLLDKKPIDRITVKDITDDCDISRNTFYYHYTDIPTLLEELLTENAEELIQSYPSIASLEECLNVGAQFVLQNRRAAMHIYNSTHRYIYEKCLMKVCRRVISSYFDVAVPNDLLADEDRDILIDYYKCFTFGCIADWCDNGMKEDYSVSFKRLLDIRRRLNNMDLEY